MIKIPSNGPWKQNNRSDIYGDLWDTFNMDLSTKLGVARISPRYNLSLGNADNANLGVAAAIKLFVQPGGTNYYNWACAGAYIWRSDVNDTWTQDNFGSTPTDLNSDQSDLCVFNGYLYVSAGSSRTLHQLSSIGVWNDFTNRLATSAGLHQMTYLRSLNRLYFVDDSSKSVGSIDTGNTAASLGAANTLQTLVDGNTAIISWIRASSTAIWVGTMNVGAGGQSKVYVWDGLTANTPTNEYLLDDDGSVACLIKDNVPVIMTTRGKLMQFNGSSFIELDRLPMDKDNLNASGLTNPTGRFLHHNGMDFIDGKICMLVNPKVRSSGVTKENCPSGVWEYTPENGLHHKSSIGLSKSGGSITDFGQQKMISVGALAQTVKGARISFLGCNYYTTASVTDNGIFAEDYNDTLQKAGVLVTSKIFSTNIQDAWQRLNVIFKKLVNTTDKIVVKYRCDYDPTPTEDTITWTATNQFTTTADLSSYAVGDEVEVIQGLGSGKCSHITVLSLNAGTYTVTVDEIYNSASGTSKAQFQKWIKAGSYTNQTITTGSQAYSTFIPYKAFGVWIQVKIWVVCTGNVELYGLIVDNKAHL